MQGENTHIHAGTHLKRQRRIQGPAGRRRTSRHEKRACEHQTGRDQQPEAEIIHTGKSHVSRANLQRNHPVGEADKAWHDGPKNHNQAMHGGELVKQLRVHKLQARLKQLGTNQHCQRTTDDQHGEAEQQVHGADVFVVGGIDPAPPARWGMAVVVVMGVVVVV